MSAETMIKGCLRGHLKGKTGDINIEYVSRRVTVEDKTGRAQLPSSITLP